jgi:hypothetical protein
VVAQKLKQVIFEHLEIQIDEDQSMELLWQKTGALELVLYEKTLYLVQAIFDR